MCFTISFILLSSCLSNQNLRQKEKMEALASAAVFKFSENAEVSKAIDSVARFTIRPVRLVLDLINQELDERFFNSLESKVKDKQKRDKRSELMRYVKDRNISVMSSMLKEEERAEWQDKLINLNEEIELTSGSTTTYACLILCKGCYNEGILRIITENLPKRNKGLYPIHLGCILGSEDFVKKLIEKDRDCLEYVSEEESIRMNSLAYASMFNHENLVKQLLEQDIRSHEGYILSVILGNHRIEKLYKEEVYREKESISQLKKVVKGLGDGNNIFHILPLIKYLKELSGAKGEENYSAKLKFMQGKREGMLLNNLLEKLKWMEFTIDDVKKMLKTKNNQGKTALEHIVLSGDEELYVAVFDAIKKVFDVEDSNNLGILEPAPELLSSVLLSGVEAGLSRSIEEVIDLFQMDEGTEVATLALNKAIGLNRNEAVFLVCKWICREPKLLTLFHRTVFLLNLEKKLRLQKQLE